MKKISLLLFVAILFSACVKIELFEKNKPISQHNWYWNDKPTFEFEVNDTVSAHNVFITLRHTASYAYRNIWLLMHTRQPGDTAYHTERIELQLQDPNGKWMEASGMDDIWDHRIYLFKTRFPRKGIYSIMLEQNMRDNPLKHIMNIGIRIEKAH